MSVMPQKIPEQEIAKFNHFLEEFTGEMRARFSTKAKMNYVGWDDKQFESYIENGVIKAHKEKKWVDVANYALMLWLIGKDEK